MHHTRYCKHNYPSTYGRSIVTLLTGFPFCSFGHLIRARWPYLTLATDSRGQEFDPLCFLGYPCLTPCYGPSIQLVDTVGKSLNSGIPVIFNGSIPTCGKTQGYFSMRVYSRGVPLLGIVSGESDLVGCKQFIPLLYVTP